MERPLSSNYYVVVKEPNKNPEILQVDSHKLSLKFLQSKVGGPIELTVFGTYDLYFHEEGRLLNLPINLIIDRLVILGTVLGCKSDKEGDTLALTLKEAEELISRLGYV